VLLVVEPEGEGVRIDSALLLGGDVSTDYDPLLAKVIATGADRAEALARLRVALAATTVLGLTTNLAFLRRLLADPDVEAGRLDTGLIERRLSELTAAEAMVDGPAVAALVLLAVERRTAPEGPWGALPGFRLHRPAPAVVVFSAPDASIAVTGPLTAATLRVDDGPQRTASITLLEHGGARVRIGDRSRTIHWAIDGGTVWLSDGRATATFDTARAASVSAAVDGDRELRSPMPGTVVAVEVADGERVDVGTRVLVVEAMKMEHVVRSASPGLVELRIRAGQRVERGGLLAIVHDEEVVS
jgi:acetyl-CoA/propionyl-CoA carboxylase biotin carboxyl carrier protein